MTPTKTIKERLVDRFAEAKKELGAHWRYHLEKSDPFFATREGGIYMEQTAGALANAKRVSVDRIERVVLAMEKLTGVQSQPVA